MEKTYKRASMTVVKRLPKYYRYLSDLESKKIEKISSKDLAEMMGLTASQIRQDLNAFGAYGQQGYGYRVQDLKQEIWKILGLNANYNCIIIGSGNLGKALSNYEKFRKEGIHIIGMFDADQKKVGEVVGDNKILHLDQLKNFVKDNTVDICILAVPRSVGQQVTDLVCELGIPSILNFAPIDLVVPDNVKVASVNITDSMFTLTYQLNEERLS